MSSHSKPSAFSQASWKILKISDLASSMESTLHSKPTRYSSVRCPAVIRRSRPSLMRDTVESGFVGVVDAGGVGGRTGRWR